MLQAKITWAANGDAESALHLDIVNVRRRRYSDYQVELYGTDRQSVKNDCLFAYPRWSEPALALVARSLRTIFPESDIPSEMVSLNKRIIRLNIALRLTSGALGHQRELDSIEVSTGTLKHYSELIPRAPIPFTLTREDTDPCQLAIRAICTAVFGTNNLPEYPEAFNPVIRESAGLKYVRLDEIPEPIRTAFSDF